MSRLTFWGAKSGRRDTPIERTILLPILQEYVSTLNKPTLLFPSIPPPGTRRRKITAVGRWSGASAFSSVWREVAKRCRERLKEKYKLSAAETAFCSLGPRAWRRSAVTFMHGAGCLPAQVARWVGHSVQIEDRHYLGNVKRNGLVYEEPR